MKPIAENHRGALNFATIDALEFAFFAEPLGLIPGKFPAFVIQDVVSGDTAPLDQNTELTAGRVGKFVSTYLEGRRLAGDGSEVCTTKFEMVLSGDS